MEHAAEHLEHVEHQKHAGHSPFDRKVAMSMAILAALLATVTLLGHRAHNETLLFQTKASDQWNFYQAKNIRQHEYEAFVLLTDGLSKESRNEEGMKKAQDQWTSKLAKYKDELPKMQSEAEKLEKESHLHHDRAMRFDLGELGLQLSLILCSIAILVKRAPFWYAGIAAGVAGVVVALTAFLIQH
jgi:hypothetical protein